MRHPGTSSSEKSLLFLPRSEGAGGRETDFQSSNTGGSMVDTETGVSEKKSNSHNSEKQGDGGLW